VFSHAALSADARVIFEAKGSGTLTRRRAAGAIIRPASPILRRFPMTPSLVLLALLTACAPGPDAPRPALLVAPGVGGEWDDPTVIAGRVPFTTIQDAIDAAASGDTVVIPSGTYTENISIAASITVQGAGQGETIIVGTIDITGMTQTTLSGVSVISPTYVSAGTLYTTTSGIYSRPV
jgi:pectin methylesterase-like acyl-CoA thioesterase